MTGARPCASGAKMRGSSRGASSKAISSATSASRAGSRQQRQRHLAAAAVVPAQAAAGRDQADLGGDELQPAAVEGPAEIDGDGLVPVPAHLDDGAFRAGAGNGGVQAGRAGAGVEDDVGLAGGAVRRCQVGAQRFEDGPAGLRRRRRPSPWRRAAGQRGLVTSSPTTPAPTTTMRSPGPAPASHRALRAVSMLAARVARRAGTASGTTARAVRGGIEIVLVRMQAEDGLSPQLRRPLLYNSRRAVAVFDGEGERRLPASVRACAPTRFGRRRR